jgi:pimeloyl-ACP methyl ester carboxylesterase
VGFDAKAYLASFTSRSSALRVEDVARDYAALVADAAAAGSARPLLVGVSEGAGLSVLAACAPELRSRVAGVVALGLPDRNELGWRFRDSLIYLTKKTPDEPTFRVSEVVERLAPVPLAAIHSRHDEFVPVAEVDGILEKAREPKRLWLVDAADHRFGGARPQLEQCMADAIAWIESAGPRPGP